MKSSAAKALLTFLSYWRWWWLPMFIGLPSLELFLLLQLGAWMGPTLTFLVILFTGGLGAWLAKREGWNVLRTLRDELKSGMPPGSRLMEGALVVAGGLLLLTPGVFTDLTGFLLIAPPTRAFIATVSLEALLAFFQIDARVDMSRVKASGPTAKNPNNPFATPFD